MTHKITEIVWGMAVWELCDMVSVNIIINIMYYQHAKVSNKHV